MIRINLLPLAEREPKWPVDRLLIVTGCLLSIIFSCLYSYNIFTLWNLESKVQATQNQYQLLKPTRDIMANANNKQQLFDKKNNILIKLTKERQSLYAIIQHIAVVSPTKIWFTEMAKGDKGTIQIKGWAVNYTEIAQFMKIMEDDKLMIESALTNVEKKDTATAATFEIVVKPRGI